MLEGLAAVWLLVQLLWGQAAAAPAATSTCLELTQQLTEMAGTSRVLPGGWRASELTLADCSDGEAGPVVTLIARGEVEPGWPVVELLAERVPWPSARRLRPRLERFLQAAAEQLAWARDSASCNRFMARYGLERVRLLRSGQDAGWLLQFWGRRRYGRYQAYLALEQRARDPVRAYAVAGVAGLPVRRELLRLAEQASDRLPGCRVAWVEARSLPATDSGQHEPAQSEPCPPRDADCIPDRWQVLGLLAGPACPRALGVTVDQRLRVSDSVVYQAGEELPWTPPR